MVLRPKKPQARIGVRAVETKPRAKGKGSVAEELKPPTKFNPLN
jgi:hypothetical protein